jgi:hypothetical protein
MASNADAYLGPGLGAGTVAIIFGIIVSVFLAIASVVYYPIKRFLKKSKTSGEGRDRA